MNRQWKNVPGRWSRARLLFAAALAGAGVVVTTTSQAGEVNYTYDVHGRVTTRVTTTPAGDVVTVSYGNDSANNRTSVTTTTVDPIKPTVPTGLTATVVSATRIDLSWNASTDGGGSGLAGYKIRRNGTQIATTANTSYADTTVVGSTTYQYTVSAYDGYGNESAQSSAVSASTPDITPPSVPTGLTGYSVDSTWVNLSWNASTDAGGSGLAGYEVYRGGSVVGTSPTNSYADHSVVASTQYTYTVKAYDGAGNRSAASSGFTITTPNAPDTTPPSVPAGLSASAPSSGTVNLSWAASSDPGPNGTGVAGYRVYRGGAYLGTSSATSFSDNTTVGSTHYTYQVLAYDGAGNSSALSAAVGITTPDTIAPSTPTGLSASAVASNRVNLSWSAASDTGGSGIAGYKVYRGGAYIGSSATTSYSDTTTVANTTYTYQVLAYDGANNSSALSSSVTVTTTDTLAPSAPGNPTFSSITGSSATANWSAASDNVGVTGYRYSLNGGSTWTNVSGTSADLSGLTRSTTYTMLVQARDAVGNWGASSSGSFTTAAYYTDYLAMTSATEGDGINGARTTGYWPLFGSLTPNTISGGKTITAYFASYQLAFDGVNWTASVYTTVQVTGFSGNPGAGWLQSIDGLSGASAVFGCINSTTCSWSWTVHAAPPATVTIVHQ